MNSPLVIDPGPLAAAIQYLLRENSGELVPLNEVQRDFLAWSRELEGPIRQLNGLEFKVSDSADELNDFMEVNGLPRFFSTIQPDGLSIATVLDVPFTWPIPGTKGLIMAPQNGKFYQSFEIQPTGVLLYNMAGFEQPVAQLVTSTGVSAWLAMTSEPLDELAMLELADHILSTERNHKGDYDGVEVPCLTINARPNLSWMSGLRLPGGQIIAQCVQVVKLRLDEKGGHLTSGTGVSTTRATPREPLRFDQPFMGFITQPNSRVPLGLFHTRPDDGAWELPRPSCDAQ